MKRKEPQTTPEEEGIELLPDAMGTRHQNSRATRAYSSWNDQAETEKAACYSSSLSGNSSWRLGSPLGGKSLAFLRLERDFLLDFFGSTNPPIGQAFAADPLRHLGHALIVIDAERRTFVVAEIKLGEVAVQMRLGNVMVGADDPALKDREVVLDGVHVCEACEAHVFLGAVVDATMSGKTFGE